MNEPVLPPNYQPPTNPPQPNYQPPQPGYNPQPQNYYQQPQIPVQATVAPKKKNTGIIIALVVVATTFFLIIAVLIISVFALRNLDRTQTDDQRKTTIQTTDQTGEDANETSSSGSDRVNQGRSTNGKTHIAIYMVGSDLEDDLSPRDNKPDPESVLKQIKYPTATTDLVTIAKSYEAMTSSQRSLVSVDVAFGGSRRENWEGIKYADMECIAKDYKDKIFGNDTCYSYTNENANMSEGAVYTAFLKHVKTKQKDTQKRFLINWNHGGAYNGFGWDSNKSNGDNITLAEMTKSLEQSDSDFDVIGFDACLMANLEVAKSLRKYADYLIASEEVIYTSWADEMYTYAARNPKATALDISKAAVDYFVDSKGKTSANRSYEYILSVVDLGKYQEVASSLESLSKKLVEAVDTDKSKILSAASRSQYYGRSEQSKTDYSIDLVDFSEKLAASVPSLKTEANDLATKTKKMVVHNKQNGTKPRSNGLSIVSPTNDKLWRSKSYTKEMSPSSSWYAFLGKIFSKESSISRAAVVRNFNGCQEDTTKFCVEMEVDPNVKRVSIAYTKKSTDENVYIVSRSEEMFETAENTYMASKWDSSQIFMCNHQNPDKFCDTFDMRLFLVFARYDEQGNRVYTSQVKINEAEATLFLVFDNASQKIIDYWYMVSNKNQEGSEIVSKTALQFKVGDSLAPYNKFYDISTNTESYELGKTTVLTEGFQWLSFAVTGGGREHYFIVTEDIFGNIKISEPKEYSAR